MHFPHPSTLSNLIKNVYIYKQENRAFNSDYFSVTLARDKERIQETIFKIFTLNVGQTLLAKKSILGTASLFLEKVEELFSKDVITLQLELCVQICRVAFKRKLCWGGGCRVVV